MRRVVDRVVFWLLLAVLAWSVAGTVHAQTCLVCDPVGIAYLNATYGGAYGAFTCTLGSGSPPTSCPCTPFSAVSVVSGSCPPSCSTSDPSMDLLDAIGQSSSTGSLCVNGCLYTNSASTMTVGPGDVGGPTVYGKANPAGGTCGSNTAGVQASPAQHGNNCISAGGTLDCVNTTGGGTPKPTVNGDVVAPALVPSGGCLGFSDGSVACNASAAPPVPDNGTPGTPATPTAVVGAGGGTSGGTGSATEINYYNSATVAASHAPVLVGAVGQSSAGGTSTGGGSGGPNASNGDCGANGVNCAGSLPSADSSDGTFSSVNAAFMASIASSPIVSSTSGMAAAWTGGTCPTMTVTLGTLPGHTYDYGTTFCSFYASYVATPLAAAMLVVWSLLGVFIFLSA